MLEKTASLRYTIFSRSTQFLLVDVDVINSPRKTFKSFVLKHIFEYLLWFLGTGKCNELEVGLCGEKDISINKNNRMLLILKCVCIQHVGKINTNRIKKGFLRKFEQDFGV